MLNHRKIRAHRPLNIIEERFLNTKWCFIKAMDGHNLHYAVNVGTTCWKIMSRDGNSLAL